jgi:hypothetical protein
VVALHLGYVAYTDPQRPAKGDVSTEKG